MTFSLLLCYVMGLLEKSTALHQLLNLIQETFEIRKVLFHFKKGIIRWKPKISKIEKKITSENEAMLRWIKKPKKFGRFVSKQNCVTQIGTNHFLRPASRTPSRLACTCPAALCREVWLGEKNKENRHYDEQLYQYFCTLNVLPDVKS